MGKNVVEQRAHSSFFETVANSPRRLLLIDFDKALAPALTYDALYSRISDRLQRVFTDKATRVVILSSRPAQDVCMSLGIELVPEIWGGDGLERIYSDGRYHGGELDIPVEALEALAESEIALRREGIGKFVQVSVAAISVYWRGLTDVDDLLDIRAKAQRVFRPLAHRHPSLRFLELEGGVELRLIGTTKGDILRRLLSGVSAETPVAYVGDDPADGESVQLLNGRDLTVVVNVVSRVENVRKQGPEDFTHFLDEWIRATQRAFRVGLS